MQATLLSNGLILTMSDRVAPTTLPTGWVGIVDRKIALVTTDPLQVDQFRASTQVSGATLREIDCGGCVVMPGLINTHSHVAMTLMRNFADDKELMDWLENYIWPFEALQTSEDIAVGARLGIAEMLLGGTTSFIDMYWSESVIAKVVDQMGIRAMLCEALVSGREESFVEEMDRLREVASCSSRVICGVGPHAPYTCSPATLKVARDYATTHSLPVTIHLNETAFERQTIENQYGKSPLEYIEEAGLLERHTVLAHCVDMCDDEIKRLADEGLYVAHSPQSNMKLASGVAPLTKMCGEGVCCTVSTDGVSSNNDLDMWEEMRTAILLQRAVTCNPSAIMPYDILTMATRNGAKALGMSDKLGELKEGMLADIIVVNLNTPHTTPLNNPLSALAFCTKSADVRDVFVDGEQRVSNHTLLSHNITDLITTATLHSRKISEQM